MTGRLRAVVSRGLLAALPLVLLTACADKPPAPIEDHSRPGYIRADDRYTVLAGDTLFAIAFRYGLDYRRLAAANGIAAPFTIYPGQTLRLAEADAAAPAPVAATTTAQSTEVRAPSPSTATPSREPSRAAATGSAVAGTATAGTAPATAGTASAAAGTAPATATRPAASAPRVTSRPRSIAPSRPSSTGWLWPAEGALSRRFDANRSKGIDIAGERGDPVIASAAGEVVYAGTGIAGYGLMLIIRHSNNHLSAYGHADSLLVDERDRVEAGDVVAEMGSSGTDSVKLHFEIRREGRPVDPLGLLPRRP